MRSNPSASASRSCRAAATGAELLALRVQQRARVGPGAVEQGQLGQPVQMARRGCGFARLGPPGSRRLPGRPGSRRPATGPGPRWRSPLRPSARNPTARVAAASGRRRAWAPRQTSRVCTHSGEQAGRWRTPFRACSHTRRSTSHWDSDSDGAADGGIPPGFLRQGARPGGGPSPWVSFFFFFFFFFFFLAAISRAAGLHKDWLSRHLRQVDPAGASVARQRGTSLDGPWLPTVRRLGFTDVPSYLRDRHHAEHRTVSAIAARPWSCTGSSPRCGGTGLAIIAHVTKRHAARGSERTASSPRWGTPAWPAISASAGPTAGRGRRWRPNPASRPRGCAGRRNLTGSSERIHTKGSGRRGSDAGRISFSTTCGLPGSTRSACWSRPHPGGPRP